MNNTTIIPVLIERQDAVFFSQQLGPRISDLLDPEIMWELPFFYGPDPNNDDGLSKDDVYDPAIHLTCLFMHRG